MVAASLPGCAEPVGPTAPITEDPQARLGSDSVAIKELVLSGGKYDEAPRWSRRQESLSTDTVATVDTADFQINHTIWLEEKITYSASDNPDTYFQFNPQAGIVWPGNLIQGKTIASGAPDAIPITDRESGNVTLAIVSGDSAGTVNRFSREISRFRYSDVNQAMNEILAGYRGGTPARYSYEMEEVHSVTQLNFDLAFGYAGPAARLAASFGMNLQQKRSRLAVRLTQQYFTMVFDDPEGPAGVFGPSVTAASLAPYTSAGNPICYISSVTYGRIYVLVYESTASLQELRAALNFAYSGGIASGNIDTKSGFTDVMSKTTVKVIQIGGDPSAGLTTVSGVNYDAIQQFLVRGANFSATNIGEPISYTIRYLGDASLVRMNNLMSYTVTQRTPLSSTTSYTKSKFNIAFRELFVVSSTDPGGGDGGIRITVGTTDTRTGQDSTVWTSPINLGGPADGFWDFGQDAMKSGTTFAIPWTVPEIMLEDNTVKRLFIRFEVNEFDSFRQWNQGYQVYEFVPAQRRWVRKNTDWPNSEFYLTVDDTTVKFVYEVKRNDQVVQ